MSRFLELIARNKFQRIALSVLLVISVSLGLQAYNAKQNIRYDNLNMRLDKTQSDMTKKLQDVQKDRDAIKQQLDAEKAGNDKLKHDNEELNKQLSAKKEAARLAALPSWFNSTGGVGGEFTGTISGSTAGNTYAAGNCTWYAKSRRPDLPNNLGNASTWAVRAAAQGIATGQAPRAGAIGQQGNHVVYIERVNDDGTVYLSEMNYAGLGVTSTRTAPAGNFNYIY